MTIGLSAPHAKAALFDPTKGTWMTLPAMKSARAAASVARLPDERVLLMGGFKGSLLAPKATSAVESYVPATKSFRLEVPLPTPIGGASPMELATGQALFLGGLGGVLPAPLDSALLFFPR